MPWVLRRTDVEGEYKPTIDCSVDGFVFSELLSLVESGQLQNNNTHLFDGH